MRETFVRHKIEKVSPAGETEVQTPESLKFQNYGSALLFHGHIFQELIVPVIESFVSVLAWATLYQCSIIQL